MNQGKLINIGISACLAGEPVRYDGGHIYIAELYEYLSSMFTLVPVCPEVAIGMGVPRAPIQLVGGPETSRALGVHSPALDVTDRLTAFAKYTLQSQPALDGFVVKARSPSCGLATTPLFDNDNRQTGTGSGIFTRTLIATCPAIPLVDESCVGNGAEMDLFAVQICVHAVFRKQVLEAEDKQAALNLFRENLAAIAGVKVTSRFVLPARLPASIDPEEFIKQYMGRIREQLSDKDPLNARLTRADHLNAAHFNEERVNELMEKLV